MYQDTKIYKHLHCPILLSKEDDSFASSKSPTRCLTLGFVPVSWTLRWSPSRNEEVKRGENCFILDWKDTDEWTKKESRGFKKRKKQLFEKEFHWGKPRKRVRAAIKLELLSKGQSYSNRFFRMFEM